MNIATLQTRAWDIAETKGHHDALHQPVPDARNAALATLATVYARLNAITQHVKRHGVAPAEMGALVDLMRDTVFTLIQWGTDVEQGTIPPLSHYATLVRLVLLHTEVSEAIDVVNDHDMLAGELADILIRTSEIAEEHHIGLSGVVVATLEKNLLRPKYYGTPHQEDAL